MASSAGTTINGTVSGTAPLALWVAGFPLPDLPPAAPTGLTAAAGDGLVALSWNAVGEADVVGYNVFRSTTSPVTTAPGTQINGGTPVTGTRFTEGGLGNGQTYFYAVTAVDASSQSSASNEATAMPLSALSNGLDFDGSNDYVTFGAASGLGTATFTIETWFRRDGAGSATTTSGPTGGGLQDAIPLVTKGRGEADGSLVRHELVPGHRRELGGAGRRLRGGHRPADSGAEPHGRGTHARSRRTAPGITPP